jgi:ferric-dicitrate binding protein FerR (iron transport regulator)
MNAKKIEKWVLLEQSGELPPRKQNILNACPQTQQMREELNALFKAVPAADPEPSPRAATRIHARLRQERRPVLLSARVWSPVLAAAACLMLLVNIFNFMPGSSPASAATVAVGEADVWNVRFEEDLAELEGLILAISDTPLDIMEM